MASVPHVREVWSQAANWRRLRAMVRRVVHILNEMKAKIVAQAKYVAVGSGVGSIGVAVIANNGSSEAPGPGIFQLSMPLKAEEVV